MESIVIEIQLGVMNVNANCKKEFMIKQRRIHDENLCLNFGELSRNMEIKTCKHNQKFKQRVVGLYIFIHHEPTYFFLLFLLELTLNRKIREVELCGISIYENVRNLRKPLNC